MVVPGAFASIEKAPEVAETEAGGGEQGGEAARDDAAEGQLPARRRHELDAPGLHPQGLAALGPEHAKETDAAHDDDRLHDPRRQTVLDGVAAGLPQLECREIADHDQRNDEERVVHHRNDTT